MFTDKYGNTPKDPVGQSTLYKVKETDSRLRFLKLRFKFC